MEDELYYRYRKDGESKCSLVLCQFILLVVFGSLTVVFTYFYLMIEHDVNCYVLPESDQPLTDQQYYGLSIEQ